MARTAAGPPTVVDDPLEQLETLGQRLRAVELRAKNRYDAGTHTQSQERTSGRDPQRGGGADSSYSTGASNMGQAGRGHGRSGPHAQAPHITYGGSARPEILILQRGPVWFRPAVTAYSHVRNKRYSINLSAGAPPLSLSCPSGAPPLSLSCPSGAPPLSLSCPSGAPPLSLSCPSGAPPLSLLCPSGAPPLREDIEDVAVVTTSGEGSLLSVLERRLGDCVEDLVDMALMQSTTGTQLKAKLVIRLGKQLFGEVRCRREDFYRQDLDKRGDTAAHVVMDMIANRELTTTYEVNIPHHVRQRVLAQVTGQGGRNPVKVTERYRLNVVDSHTQEELELDCKVEELGQGLVLGSVKRDNLRMCNVDISRPGDDLDLRLQLTAKQYLADESYSPSLRQFVEQCSPGDESSCLVTSNHLGGNLRLTRVRSIHKEVYRLGEDMWIMKDMKVQDIDGTRGSSPVQVLHILEAQSTAWDTTQSEGIFLEDVEAINDIRHGILTNFEAFLTRVWQTIG